MIDLSYSRASNSVHGSGGSNGRMLHVQSSSQLMNERKVERKLVSAQSMREADHGTDHATETFHEQHQQHQQHSSPNNIDSTIQVRLREDIVFSQMLSAVIEAFRTKLYLAVSSAGHASMNSNVQYDGADRLLQLETMFRAGFLVQLESLVSTQGAEQGMLDDGSGYNLKKLNWL